MHFFFADVMWMFPCYAVNRKDYFIWTISDHTTFLQRNLLHNFEKKMGWVLAHRELLGGNVAWFLTVPKCIDGPR